MLIEVCLAILAADAAGDLHDSQARLATQARITGASAKSGITNLVYALAGYNPSAGEIIQAFKAFVQEDATISANHHPDGRKNKRRNYTCWVKPGFKLMHPLRRNRHKRRTARAAPIINAAPTSPPRRRAVSFSVNDRTCPAVSKVAIAPMAPATPYFPSLNAC